MDLPGLSGPSWFMFGKTIPAMKKEGERGNEEASVFQIH
jgi:hypothetical protein